MTYEQFKNDIVKTFKESQDDLEDVIVKTTLKNNGVSLDGLVVKSNNSNIAPTIYLNSYYKQLEDGKTFEEIKDKILNDYNNSKKNKPLDISFFMNFDSKVKSRIYYKVINRDRNKELLSRVPYVSYLDLAIVFYYLMPSSEDFEFDGFGAIMITNEHMELWKIETQELMDAASQNTPQLLGLKVRGLLTTIADYMNDEELAIMAQEEDSYVPLYVATNERAIDGASVILYKDMLKAMAEKLKSDIFIIPCSIHEVIIVKVTKGCQMDTDSLKDLISYVNKTEVAESEILSDSLYYYSKDDDALCIA